MVEIEWDGLEPTDRDRALLFAQLRRLFAALDERARVALVLRWEDGEHDVRIDAHDGCDRVDVRVRHPHLPIALSRATELLGARWAAGAA